MRLLADTAQGWDGPTLAVVVLLAVAVGLLITRR